MTSRTGTYVIPNHIRDAAIADYHTIRGIQRPLMPEPRSA